MAEMKTQKTTASVATFLKAIKDPQVRADCQTLVEIMQAVTGEKPRMWGTGLVGFGSYHYVYASGREGDWPLTAFAPRKQNLTVYIMPGFAQHQDLLAKLGPHKTAVSCLYIKRLSDIHLPTLKKIITASVKHMKKTYAAAFARK
jgi:hypothetical protein